MLRLRYYQTEAVDAAFEAMNKGPECAPCIVIATGGGKGICVAEIVREMLSLDPPGRVLIVTHVKELLEQLAGSLAKLCPTADVGMYSAGLGKRELGALVTIAGLQSIYDKAGELSEAGPIELVIVDEAHLIRTDGEGMYGRLLAELRERNPRVRLVGLTATPWRMDSGPLCGPDRMLTEVCYEAKTLDLIRQGFLSPLVSKASLKELDLSGIKTQAGDFAKKQLSEFMSVDERVEAAVEELLRLAEGRRSGVIFCCSIEHGEAVTRKLESCGETVAQVYGKTPKDERAVALERFKAGELRWLVNVMVCSIGFDAPNVDCLVMLRPTLSVPLYVQQVGRALRKAEGKDNALVIDMAGNIQRHGAVTCVNEPRATPPGEPTCKTCPECQVAGIPLGQSVCHDCGYQWPDDERGAKREPKHDTKASDEDPMAERRRPRWYAVQEVLYAVHQKHGEPEDYPKSMRVTYRINLSYAVSEWIAIEHPRGAFRARHWWSDRSKPWRVEVPETAEQAVAMARDGVLRTPKAIAVLNDGKYDRVVAYQDAEEGEEVPCG